jgi:hypothetical protein
MEKDLKYRSLSFSVKNAGRQTIFMTIINRRIIAITVKIHWIPKKTSCQINSSTATTPKNEGKLLKRAAKDNPAALYGQKALLKLEELIQKNNIPPQCTQAWY